MKNLTEQDVINIIKQFNTQQGGTQGGFTVPRHQHNGSDALKVQMGDIAPDVRGLNFLREKGFININSDGKDTLRLSVNNTNSVDIMSMSPNQVSWSILNTNSDIGTIQFNSSNWKVSSTLPWYFKLPVDLTLPTAPTLGSICYYSSDGGLTGNLYVCESPGVWTVK